MKDDHFPTPEEAAELDKIFGEAMRGDELEQARIADIHRRNWLLGAKVACLVIGATIAVIGTTIAMAWPW